MGEPSRSLPTSWISKPPKKKPKGTGKKKIEIKKIENNSSRKVAFSKRRQGMFKKAGQLCLLCLAEIAIIVFSPKGRLYSFGHPSPDYVIDKFLIENDDEINFSDDNDDCVTEITEEEKSSSEMYEEKEEGKSSSEMYEEKEEGFWWEESIEDLDLEELERYKICLTEFKSNVAMKVKEMVTRRTCVRDFLSLRLKGIE